MSGWRKVNIHAADGHFGAGSVIRDAQGRFIAARSRKIEEAWQPREAEALSLKEALAWVSEQNFDHCVFEMDSSSFGL